MRAPCDRRWRAAGPSIREMTKSGDGALAGAASKLLAGFLPAKRRKAGLAYAEGERVVAEALRGGWKRHVVFAAGDWMEGAGAELIARARAVGVRVVATSRGGMAKLSAVESAPPVGIIVEPPPGRLDDLLDAPRIVILDGVSDPGNAGTLIRSGVAFGFRVVLLGGSVTLTNEKLIRSTAGLCFLPGAVVGGLGREAVSVALRDGGFSVYTLEPGAGDLLEGVKGADRMALVVGGEAAGVRAADWPGATGIRIGIRPGVDSLNAAVAGSIAMHHLAGEAHA